VDERERQRLKLTHQIARMLQNRSFRAVLSPLRDGTSSFVVGLPDDTMHDIGQRVSALGGCAHLVVVTELEDGSRVQVFEVEEGPHKEICDINDDDECAISDDTTLSTFMDAVQVGDVRVFHVYDFETIVRFINDSVQPAVPV
jgi:hypothetical protein